MKHLSLVSAVTLGVLATAALAAKVGDPAAPLAIKEWVKGQPINVTDGKAVYVVEFWATWCPPCRTSIPHLTKLQKEFKDKGVVFIGISDETPEKVKPFVTEMGDKMEYTVAIDDGRKSNEGYMKAFDQNGIPHAFIVGKDGKVIWQGHPMAGLDKALEQIAAGTYDVKAAIKADERRATIAEYQKLAAAGDAKAKELGQKVLTEMGTDVEGLTQFAMGIAGGRGANRDFALAEEALDKADKAAGEKTAKVLAIRAIARFESGKQEEGLAMAKEAVKLAKDDVERKQYERYVSVMERRMKK